MKTDFKEAVKFLSAFDHESLIILACYDTFVVCELISRGFNRSSGQPVRQARGRL